MLSSIQQMSLSTQCTFLVFLYARVFGFLGPEIGSDPPTCVTLDRSPIEFSWIIPSKKAKKGEANRNIRCVMEPLCVQPLRMMFRYTSLMVSISDPRGSGYMLKGSSVLKYLASYAGSLGGVVRCNWDGLLWTETTEGFFFPQEHKGDYVQDGGRFAIGRSSNEFSGRSSALITRIFDRL